MAKLSAVAEPSNREPETRKGSRTRERIFDAAVEEFSEHGYAGARIERIAHLAGINKQRIYAYFGDKEGLFVEVWQQTSSLIEEEDQALLSLGSEHIADLGEILLGRYMRFHEEHPRFWRIFVLENLMGSRRHQRARHGKPYAHVRELYEAGQRRGIYDVEVSFESFLYVLIAVTFFYASNRKTMSDTLGIDLSRPEVKDRLFSEIRRLLFGVGT